MERIAYIDIQKYAGVSGMIRTGTVVLTNRQKQHIISRRGQDFFDKYGGFFREVAEDPDYIFKDKAHDNTAIASKTISLDGGHVNLVIRLAVEGDEKGLENFIITAIAENDKRYRQRLRNNVPLYRRE